MKKTVYSILLLGLGVAGWLVWRWSMILPLDQRFDRKLQDFAFIIPSLKPIPVIGSPRASTCGGCHQAIYKEWSQTTHAHALEDLQFQAELAKPDNPAWLCLNCHIPVENQRKLQVVGLMQGDLFQPVTLENPDFDPIMQKEAITCAVCHVRADKETGESYIIGSLGSLLAPHPVKKDKPFLRTICLRCHDPQGERLTPNLFCWFQTRDELESGQASLQKTTGREQDCVDCHMPEIERRIAAVGNLPKRKSHQHHWVGGGVPKKFEHYQGLLGREFKPGLNLEVENPLKQDLDHWFLSIIFSNPKGGHKIPTGDPERNYLTRVALLAANGGIISHAVYRIGQTWEWSPARKLDDNRLSQGESRRWEFHLKTSPDQLAKSIQIHTWHVKLPGKTAKYMQNTQGVRGDLNPHAPEQVKNLTEYYPSATLIYAESIQIPSLKRTRLSPQRLMEISAREAEKPLEEREY